jgi:NAD(P)H-hydrate epimerase
MSDDTTQAELIRLLEKAGEAHHAAYEETDGADPDWPIWYADYLHADLTRLLKATFTQSELVYLLVGLDKEVQQRAPGANWHRYYAKALIARYL